MNKTPRIALGALSLTLLLAACGSGEQDESDGFTVVSTTTILGDVAGDIATCGGANAVTLMPVGADPHEFAPSSEQVATLVGADLVVANGLGLEEGLQQALESAETDGAPVMHVAELVDPLPFGEDEHAHGDEDEHAHGEEEDHADEGAADLADEHAHGGEDPHFWLDMDRVARAAELIGEQLAQTTGDQVFIDCGNEVAAEIRAAETEVIGTLDSIPEGKRVLVTDHDAFGYFADRYGFEVAGTVIPGGSTLGSPSSAELADLVATMRAEGVTTIFANTAEPETLADAVAAELADGSTPVDVQVIPLYVGSLGETGSEADTYIGMMSTNAQLIAKGLNR
ncbi:MAG: hypothetical protein RJB01_426 [Actinomycetota bacterium]